MRSPHQLTWAKQRCQEPIQNWFLAPLFPPNSAHPGWVKTEMGGPSAPLELSEGGKTSIELAALPADGPTGGYFHLGKRVPW
jgi:hypothetical protein